MTHDHEHRDFVCRDCGALITCLSCIEVRARTLPHGPAFVNFHLQPPEMAPKPEFETIGVNNDSICSHARPQRYSHQSYRSTNDRYSDNHHRGKLPTRRYVATARH